MTPDRWLVLTVRVPSEELTESLAEGLLSLGGLAVEDEVDILTTYVPEPADPPEFLRGAADRLEAIAGRAPEMIWRWQADEDWSRKWRQGLGPRRVGRRLVVTQPWNAVDDGDLVIVIDPATAFGTGEHATTRGALELLERCVRGGERVLDVGTGSGILAIAAVLHGAGTVLAAESDDAALGSCRENLERNGVADRVTLEHALVDDAYLASQGRFDVITANVLSRVLVPLMPAFARALEPGGRLILGGILTEESAGIASAARDQRLAVRDEIVEGEWWTGLLEPGPAVTPESASGPAAAGSG